LRCHCACNRGYGQSAPGKIDLLGSQETPGWLLVYVARFGRRRARKPSRRSTSCYSRDRGGEHSEPSTSPTCCRGVDGHKFLRRKPPDLAGSSSDPCGLHRMRTVQEKEWPRIQLANRALWSYRCVLFINSRCLFVGLSFLHVGFKCGDHNRDGNIANRPKHVKHGGTVLWAVCEHNFFRPLLE